MDNYSDSFSSSDDEVLVMQLYFLTKRKREKRMEQLPARKKAKRTHKHWVHPIIELREAQGAYNNLVTELRSDIVRFFNFHRMTPAKFDELLALVEPIITKKHVTREPLPPGLKLSLTLRYLASGNSMASLYYTV